MEKIFTISGKAEAGKDTFALFLKNKLPNKKVLIIHYADYLKYIAKQYFGWSGNKDKDGRTLLQELGTEKVRTKFPDFWVGTVANFIKVFYYDFDYFLITDCRYLNEINYLKEKQLPVFTVRINRNHHENSLTLAQREHISETALDSYIFNYTLNMSEGLENVEREAGIFISAFNL